jgi:hypothetical protein
MVTIKMQKMSIHCYRNLIAFVVGEVTGKETDFGWNP